MLKSVKGKITILVVFGVFIMIITTSLVIHFTMKKFAEKRAAYNLESVLLKPIQATVEENIKKRHWDLPYF